MIRLVLQDTSGLIDYLVKCTDCGEPFEVQAEDGSLGFLFATCPYCGADADHKISPQGGMTPNASLTGERSESALKAEL